MNDPATHPVNAGVLAEIERLQHATSDQLQQRYRELFGEEPPHGRKSRLFRRLAWRLQAVAAGGLSERARQRAAEIAQDADLRIRAPRSFLIVITTYPVPPASFDFEKATDDDRTLYGIPRFTAGSSDLQKRWQETVRNLRLIEPVFKQRESRREKLPDLKPGHGTETFNNWSGGVTFPAPGDKIWSVNGTWNIPKPSPPAGAQSGILYTASTWIGIDGDDGSGDILQAGCDADVMISGGNNQYQFNPWWEWYPVGSFWITNIPTSAGDKFTCWIQCVPLLSGSANPNSALIFLANATSGLGFFFNATAPAKTSLQGNCAEWIIEALETGPKNEPELAKYTTVDFTQCSAITVRDKTVLPDSGNRINMVNSSNVVISKGKFVGSNEVQVSYV